MGPRWRRIRQDGSQPPPDPKDADGWPAPKAVPLAVSAVLFGAVVGFLSSESAGILTLLLVPVVLGLRRRPRILALLLALAGCGYLAEVGYLVHLDSASFSGPGTGGYAASMLAIGVAIVLGGLLLLGRAQGAAGKGVGPPP